MIVCCRTCEERDPSAFYPARGFRKCKNCYRRESREHYATMNIAEKNPVCPCGEMDPLNFSPNSLHLCKLCRLTRVSPERAATLEGRVNKCTDCGSEDPRHFVLNFSQICGKCLTTRRAKKLGLSGAVWCEKCQGNDEQDFFKDNGNLCKACFETLEKKSRNRGNDRIWVCRDCGKTGKENFYSSRRFKCKVCYSRYATCRRYPFYMALIKMQGGEICQICRKSPQELDKKQLSVDHDHATGLIRGLLCQRCNWTLGKVTLEQAHSLVAYLTNPPAAPLKELYPFIKEKIWKN